jgi:lipopolysaccharide/colanic/teichoic acid biosynthesis glycosyltransferase
MPASITPPETARPVFSGAPRVGRVLRPSDAPFPTTTAPGEGRCRSAYRSLRRAADVVAALIALFALAPLFAVIAVLIKLSSPGPVLYHQVRVGVNRRRRARATRVTAAAAGDRRIADRRCSDSHGRLFRIYKFRTMVPNAEEYGPQWSSPDDARIFPLGRLLRLTRLDETPQFLNVLAGDMSLIGPRPEPESPAEPRCGWPTTPRSTT